MVKQAVIWLDFRQHCSADINDNLLFQQIDSRYEQAISKLLDFDDPKLASFIWTLVDGISINQIDNSGFVAQIELLTQMLIAYFEKHILT